MCGSSSSSSLKHGDLQPNSGFFTHKALTMEAGDKKDEGKIKDFIKTSFEL